MQSDIGPEERNVEDFLHGILWKRLPVNARKGLKLKVASQPRISNSDTRCRDPAFPLEPRVYYIEAKVI
jgi:hypothetical protein